MSLDVTNCSSLSHTCVAKVDPDFKRGTIKLTQTDAPNSRGRHGSPSHVEQVSEISISGKLLSCSWAQKSWEHEHDHIIILSHTGLHQNLKIKKFHPKHSCNFKPRHRLHVAVKQLSLFLRNLSSKLLYFDICLNVSTIYFGLEFT